MVEQEVGCADGFHLLAGARLGGAETEQFHEGFVIHVRRQHDACGFDFRTLGRDCLRADRQGDRVHDGAGHARREGHGQERIVDAMTVRQAEGNVGSATGGVDAEFLAQATHQREDLMSCGGHGPDRHHQRIDHDIMRLDAEIGRALNNLLGDGKTHIGVFGNAGVIVRDRDNRNVIFLDQRENEFEALFFAGNRVQQRATFCGLETGFERAGHGAVDAQRAVGDALDDLDQLRHQHRLDKVVVGIARILGHLAGKHCAGIDVENCRAGLDLRDRVSGDTGEITTLQFFVEDLAAGRVDAFADDAERLIKSDDDFACGRGNDGAGHYSLQLI